LQELIDATTELTESVTVSKATLDAAVASAGEDAAAAASGAEVATTQASAANTSEGKAKTEADRAKKEADNAAAVVTGGTAELEPAPGKIPIADSKGHINAGWTPLLTAMYPYSGVIGSVNKGDMFTFKTDAAGDANKFTVKKRQFNINGRFVDKPQEVITLPDAEDTAARAVAFDDIFIDWNGTVTSHRSITPHRTATGYDRDAIATEHGYSKVQTGLYKVGSTYSLLLGRVARRNKGAYHPVFNPEGNAKGRNKEQRGVASWYQTGGSITSAVPITSAGACFNFNGTPATADVRSSISEGLTYIGRPEDKYSDAIYADDFTPLYYSAKNVIDRQALLFDSFNKAVNGETFSGAEGTQGKKYVGNFPSSSSVMYVAGFLDSIHGVEGFPLGYKYLCKITNKASGITLYTDVPYQKWFYVRSVLHSNKKAWMLIPDTRPDNNTDWSTFSGGDATDISYEIISFSEGVDSARPQFLAVDIIGALDHMPDEWKTEGIPGNWLAVGEEGEDLIPDGTAKNYKMSRKCLEAYQVLKTDDKGATWSDVTSTYKTAIESATNSMGSQSFAATDVFMVFYKTSANPFELANKGNVLGYGWGAYISDQSMGVVASNLLNKVPTSTEYIQFQPEMLNITDTVIHNALTGLKVTNPSVKFLTSLAHDSNAYTLKAYYKELKHNGTQWGDDNKFNIVDNQSTVTDLNGEDVIVGQKRVELPYQFDGVTY
ncbi:MAG: hypothetical protein JAY71_18725, partial [Candidatus Thiodiazotropha weberae]|nr:hypothetical protein [Candidatus Thiodiazotropha weberae]